MMTPERRKEINHIGYCNDKAVRKAIKDCFEEIDLLKEENEDMRSKITGMFAGFCPPEEAMVLREATAKAEEENRKARELLEHIAMDVASLLGEES